MYQRSVYQWVRCTVRSRVSDVCVVFYVIKVINGSVETTVRSRLSIPHFGDQDPRMNNEESDGEAHSGDER